ncbi:pyridoxamine 5'-phosphate oxidase family protein [Herbidospora sp. NBRC 101105]|uniref:pyridoxamine 5'-phosphate oxidase family protein n=1 Tax=Herbidospora sp. NBRC 101105 TaxID=3032195 RepID=UPI002552E10B|nr:pyridoxamine 5'-phosphate oxidase family protein [Herbidospora sp. NBRC 101105]
MMAGKQNPEAGTLETLNEQECLQLIGAAGIGRVAFGGALGPTIFPVNYRLLNGEIVFRIREGGTMDESLRSGIEDLEIKIAFQVDHIDETNHEGWSVLIQGPAHHVPESDIKANVDSWAGDDRNHYIRIAPQRVTGRRINRL